MLEKYNTSVGRTNVCQEERRSVEKQTMQRPAHRSGSSAAGSWTSTGLKIVGALALLRGVDCRQPTGSPNVSQFHHHHHPSPLPYGGLSPNQGLSPLPYGGGGGPVPYGARPRPTGGTPTPPTLTPQRPIPAPSPAPSVNHSGRPH